MNTNESGTGGAGLVEEAEGVAGTFAIIVISKDSSAIGTKMGPGLAEWITALTEILWCCIPQAKVPAKLILV